MNDSSVGPINDGSIAPSADLAALGREERYGRRRGDDPRLPGVLQFDRVEVNTATGVAESYAKFIVHPKSGVVSIKIIDARTDTVIREIPPDDVLKIAEELQAYLKLRTAKRG